MPRAHGLASGRRTILVLAPHTDDGEFGAGGSINRWVGEGHTVFYVAFSACQDSVPDGWPADVLIHELREATTCLGLDQERVRVLDFTVRRFAQTRQEILQALVDLKREIDPDLVLMPAVDDLHQDHHTVAMESLRAFKTVSLLSYEVPWNNIQFRTGCFVTLDDANVEAKIRALRCYRSQAARPYAKEDFQRAQLRFRGTQVTTTFAEAFEVVRWIL
jgi:LmbE family N-acetylglucosaminyl deacetylase